MCSWPLASSHHDVEQLLRGQHATFPYRLSVSRHQYTQLPPQQCRCAGCQVCHSEVICQNQLCSIGVGSRHQWSLVPARPRSLALVRVVYSARLGETLDAEFLESLSSPVMNCVAAALALQAHHRRLVLERLGLETCVVASAAARLPSLAVSYQASFRTTCERARI